MHDYVLVWHRYNESPQWRQTVHIHPQHRGPEGWAVTSVLFNLSKVFQYGTLTHQPFTKIFKKKHMFIQFLTSTTLSIHLPVMRNPIPALPRCKPGKMQMQHEAIWSPCIYSCSFDHMSVQTHDHTRGTYWRLFAWSLKLIHHTALSLVNKTGRMITKSTLDCSVFTIP